MTSHQLNLWTAYMTALGHSPNSVTTRYRTVLALLRHAGRDEPGDLTRADVLRFLARDLSANSRSAYWRTLRSLGAFLVEYDLTTETDLLRGIPQPRPARGAAHPLPDATIRQLLALPLAPDPYLWVRLGLLQGLRVHESAKLAGGDIDRAAGTLTVVGKGHDEHTVPLHPVIVRLTARRPVDTYWFPSPSRPGEPVRPTTVSAAIRAALRSIGCPARPHQLRDTFATKLQREGRDLRVTQRMGRWRSLASVQKYTGVSDDQLRTAVTFLNWGRDAA